MTSRGYDDTSLIADIESLMQANPALSQRAAIKMVAGEGSLRRIQNKMAKRSRQVPEIETDAADDLSVEIGGTLVEVKLVAAERQALAGSGERVRWTGFTDNNVLFERLRCRSMGPDHAARLSRIGRVADAFFAIMFLSMASLGLAALLGLVGAIGRFRGDLWDFAFLIPLVISLPLLLVAAVGVPVSWAIRDRILAPYYKLEEQEPITPESVRRYVLTDRALYVLAATGRSVMVQRVEAATLKGASVNVDGDYVLETAREPVTLKALPDAHVLVTRLGLWDEGSRNEQGTLALA